MTALRYLDVLLVVLAAPIMLLIGVSAPGYLIGAGAWLALRAVGIGVERVAGAVSLNQSISIRMGYMLGRLFLLAIAVIIARSASGKDAGIAALVVVAGAFTIQLALGAAFRPGRTSR
jgi:hypothetical protein